jgi:hemolysin III
MELDEKTRAKLARYTKGEEIFNAVTHIVGGAIGIAALILGIIFSVKFAGGWEVGSVILYGICIIVLYTMSAIYHFLPVSKAKAVFRIFDHCTIFLLIAGTYTPICLGPLRQTAWGWALFGFVWGAAIIGIVCNAINMHNKFIAILSQIMYVVMGWCAVAAFVPIAQIMPAMFLIYIFIGGLCYTGGIAFYAFGRKVRYFHSVWHLFCLGGTVFHFFAILFYVIL